MKILDNTDGAMTPFWSPDGESIAFFTGFDLKKIALATKAIEPICRRDSVMGGSWGITNEIVYSALGSVWRVSAAGGTPQPVVKAQKLDFWAFPSFLDDGRRIICSHWTKSTGWTIELVSIDGDAPRPLVKAFVAEVVGNALVFLQQGGLFRQPFDAAKATLKGTAVRLDVGEDRQGYLVGYALSTTGTLAYQRRVPAQLRWYDREGKPGETLKLDPSCRNPELSPDGRLLAVECSEPGTSPIDVLAPRNVWTVDLARGAPVRVTGEGGRASDAVWSPDGDQIVFSYMASDEQDADIYQTDPSGSGVPKCLLEAPHHQWVASWWPGRYLIYLNGATTGEGTPDSKENFDLYMLKESRPVPLLTSRFDGRADDPCCGPA
jgi:hypothetical protein